MYIYPLEKILKKQNSNILYEITLSGAVPINIHSLMDTNKSSILRN